MWSRNQGASNPSLDFDDQKTTTWPFKPPQQRMANRESPLWYAHSMSCRTFRNLHEKALGGDHPSDHLSSGMNQCYSWTEAGAENPGPVSVGGQKGNSDASSFTKWIIKWLQKRPLIRRSNSDRGPAPKRTAGGLQAGELFPLWSFKGLWIPNIETRLVVAKRRGLGEGWRGSLGLADVSYYM